MTKLEKVATTSAVMPNENLAKLREVFPQFVKDGQVDFDAFQAFFDKENILAGSEKYGLSWAGKSEAFKAIRVPATGTLVPDERGVGEWDKTQNIFIEGDNLEVLKLLQKHYREQIKMIYIDPPYNTGKDFIYKDNFTENKSDYYERTGQSEGGVKLTSNPESNGRYHSDWLTMMYPRLFLAKNLLKEDGVIFISIDDNEVANLRLIMDEIFGEENFIAQIAWRRTDNQPNIGLLARVKEYILCYSKSTKDLSLGKTALTERAKKEYRYEDDKGKFRRANLYDKTRGRYVFDIKSPSGKDLSGPWMISKEIFFSMREAGEIYWATGENELPYGKIYLHESEGQIPNDFLGIEFGTNQQAGLELESLFDGKRYFDFPKPVSLISHLVTIGSDNSDLVLDFFSGSGTTAHAVMAQNADDGGNRKWICVQLPESTDPDSEAFKSMGLKTIADISRERIERAGVYLDNTARQPDSGKHRVDISFKSFKLAPSNYRQWSVLSEKDDEAKLKAQMKLFADKPLVDGCNDQSVVYEVLLKEGFDLNADVKQEEKGDVTIWSATSGDRKMVVTLASKLTREQVDSLGLAKEDMFVCLDSALDDSLKVNLSKNFNVRVI